jgi:membrane protein DedA with SNARE-associated domain
MPHILGFMVQHGYGVLFVVVMAEQLGVPIPSMPVLLAMGALSGSGNYSFQLSMGLALAAALVSDNIWFVVGRKRGASALRFLCRVSLEPDSCVSSTRSWFKKLGLWAIVIAKFVPGLNTVAAPMAGLTRMPWWKFAGADIVGISAWSGAFLSVGFAFSTQLEDIAVLLETLGTRLLVVLAGVLALWIGRKYWQRHRFLGTLRGARMTPEEVKDLLDNNPEDLVIIDLRSAEEVEDKLPGALWFARSELEQRAHEIPRDRDVILYCS